MEKFETARKSDFAQICDFYRTVCEGQKSDSYGADWHYGIYPSEEELKKFLNQGEVHIFRSKDQSGREAIACAAVLEKHADPRYRDGKWKIRLPQDQVLTLHLLAVHPDFRGRHLSAGMLEYLFDYGNKHGFGSVQLDVLKGNIPAEQLYIKHGFQFVEECTVWYEDTGDQTVHLYEKKLGEAD